MTRTVPSDDLRNGTIHYFSCPTAPNCTPGDPSNFVETLNAAQITSMDTNCSSVAASNPGFGCPAGPGPNAAVMALLQQYPHPNTDAVGDGFNIRGFSFASGRPVHENTSIGRLDYNLTRNGNQRLFLRGELMDDKTTDVLQFPGTAPTQTLTDGSRGLSVGYTAVLSPTKINVIHYGYVRQSLGINGANNTQHEVILRGISDLTPFTRTTATIVPVHNFADDFTWVKGNHTIQFGGNFRMVGNIRASDANAFNDGFANGGFLAFSGIANTGQNLDPAASGFPAVASFFRNSYDFPMVALTGLVSEFDAIFNKNKAGNFLPEGQSISRHFRGLEFEPYLQDSWRIKSNLTLNFGLRYSLLQPPYEVNGVQVAPTTSLDAYFHQRGTLMQQGQFLNVFNAPITFNLSGQANGKKPYWGWDYKDFAPRISVAWSPKWRSGFLAALFGGPGKSSIRGGWGLYFDHFGESIVDQFDRQGSFGMTSQLSNAAGVLTTDVVPRFIDRLTIPGQPGNPVCSTCTTTGLYNVTPPTTGFPNQPAPDAFLIAWGLDDKLKTPYSHAFDLSIERDLGHGFSLDSAYVGRIGRRLLENLDLAMPEDIVDPTSKVDYFKAATALIQALNAGTDINNIPTTLAGGYWQNVFPLAAGQPSINVSQFGGAAGSSCSPGTYPSNPSATQAMYDAFSCFGPNETTTLQFIDDFCAPACAGSTSPTPGLLGQQFTFFQGQYASLYSWASVGTSDFNALEVTLSKRFSQGYTFDLNYTLSKSMDMGSLAERLGLFNGDFFSSSDIINSWNPRLQRSISDFDTRHQINMNWVAQVPVGRGRHFGREMNRFWDSVIGGWQLSGLYRWTSGFPFSVGDGFNFPTNWELTGNAVQIGNPGPTGASFATIPGSGPAMNVFKNPTKALAAFRFAFPGEVGMRNTLRGQGIFNIDMALQKEWNLGESRRLRLDWDTFNITNSYRFDPFTSLPTIDTAGTFGNLTNELQDERKMQFALRFDF